MVEAARYMSEHAICEHHAALPRCKSCIKALHVYSICTGRWMLGQPEKVCGCQCQRPFGQQKQGHLEL